MEITSIIMQLLDGISRGVIYFLLASGLTLIFGVLDVVNFSHGAFYMLGVFISYTIMSKLSFGFSLIVVVIIMAVIGGISEFIFFRRVYKSGHLMQILLSFGVAFIIADIIRLIWGLLPKSVNMPSIFRGLIKIGDLLIVKYNLFIIVISILIAGGMFFVLYKTKIGAIIRASSNNKEMTECAGINVKRVYLFVFMAGTGLAGMAAAIASPIVTGVLGMDAQMIQIAFGVVIIGGVGSIKGALFAAILLGILEVAGVSLLPAFSEVLMYIVIVVVLLYKPTGLFGKIIN